MCELKRPVLKASCSSYSSCKTIADTLSDVIVLTIGELIPGVFLSRIRRRCVCTSRQNYQVDLLFYSL